MVRTAAEAARRIFSPEFINRLDKVVVFSPLTHEQLPGILELELRQVQMRVRQTAKVQFLFHVRAAGKDFLLREGTDPRYGARHLKRAVERYLVCPLANLLATRQVRAGDMLCLGQARWPPVFWKEGRVSELTTSYRNASSRTSCAERVWPHDSVPFFGPSLGHGERMANVWLSAPSAP